MYSVWGSRIKKKRRRRNKEIIIMKLRRVVRGDQEELGGSLEIDLVRMIYIPI